MSLTIGSFKQETVINFNSESGKPVKEESVINLLESKKDTTICSIKKVKKVCSKLIPGTLIIATGTGLILLSQNSPSSQLVGQDIVASGLKGNVINNLPCAKAIVISVPVLAVTATIAHFIDSSGIFRNICLGILVKQLTVTVKNSMKGQPLNEAMTEGLPKRKNIKAILPSKVFAAIENCLPKNPGTGEDDLDDDDREWNTPSMTHRVMLVSALGAGAAASYFVPQLLGDSKTNLAAVYLVSGLTKTVTVGLRTLPILPEVCLGIAIIEAGYAVDYFLPNLPFSVFPPVALFGWELISDTVQQFVVGKLKDRNWILCHHSEDKESEKGKPPSLLGRVTTVTLMGMAYLGSNLLPVKSEGEDLLPAALNGSFSTTFTKGIVGKNKPDAETKKLIKKIEKAKKNNESTEELENELETKVANETMKRMLYMACRCGFYGSVIGAAKVTDDTFGTSLFVPTIAFTAKMVTSKELKEVSNYNYAVVFKNLKKRVLSYFT